MAIGSPICGADVQRRAPERTPRPHSPTCVFSSEERLSTQGRVDMVFPFWLRAQYICARMLLNTVAAVFFGKRSTKYEPGIKSNGTPECSPCCSMPSTLYKVAAQQSPLWHAKHSLQSGCPHSVQVVISPPCSACFCSFLFSVTFSIPSFNSSRPACINASRTKYSIIG